MHSEASFFLNSEGRQEAGRVQSLLFDELKRLGICRRDFSKSMNWPQDTLSRWNSPTKNSGGAWVDEMEAAWNRLGFTLVPAGWWLRVGQ